jgi:hypothetical protein
MSLVLQSSGGGSVTLNEPTTASNFTATMPAATGEVMVSGNMPAFSAYQSSAQTLSSGVMTKIQFQTEEFDTANAFDNATNYRFTPQVAGYYQISGLLSPNASTTTVRVEIYKNGSTIKRLFAGGLSSTSGNGGSALVFLNGSTDYVELYGSFAAGQAATATIEATYFQATLVRAS